MEITIEIEKDYATEALSILFSESIECNMLEKQSFDGSCIVQLILPLTYLSIPLIAKIIIKSLEARKYHVVKFRGNTVQGFNSKNTIEILNKLKDE